MSWYRLPDDYVLDLDTLPVGGKVRATPWDGDSVELEKLTDMLDSCAMGFLTVVDAAGNELDRPRLFVRVGRRRKDLASHFFAFGETNGPLPRFVGGNLPFEVFGLATPGRWCPLDVKTVEVCV